MSAKRSIARQSLRLTGLFEADLLVMLLLRQWNHPLAIDEDFRQSLLESAAEVLRASIRGEALFEEICPSNVNLVAALCYAEATTLAADQSISSLERELRERWIEAVRRAVPSCFCDPDVLL